MFEQYPDALLCLKTLNDAGYQAFFVGGCVRDSLLHRRINDIDITTDAIPSQISQVFSQYTQITNGVAFGTVGIRINKQTYEITTFRQDGEYTDYRHPAEVAFTSHLQADCQRRDFTINAMAYHPDQGILDFYHGQDDLQAGIIRCVGDPEVRFAEDALRMLRAIRFSGQLGFAIEEYTENAMNHHASALRCLSFERMYQEFIKILCCNSVESLIINHCDILAVIVPELDEMKNMEQNNPYHQYNLLLHTLKVIDGVQPKETLRLAALFHDMGKLRSRQVDTDGTVHFRGHTQKSIEFASVYLRAFGVKQMIVKQVVLLITYHDTWFAGTRSSISAVYQEFRGKSLLELVQLKQADCMAKSALALPQLVDLHELEELVITMLEQNVPYDVRQLAINGDDIIALGISPSKEIGMCLHACLEGVIAQNCENEKNALLQYLREHVLYDRS